MKTFLLILSLACSPVFPAFAQSTGGTAPGTMTPPIPGNVPPAKAAIVGSPAVGESSRDPGLAATNRASATPAAKPAPVPEETQPQQAQPNKNYAGSTVAPPGNH